MNKVSLDKEAILEAYRFRHACKEFDPARKISDDDFQFILETARLSPSSFGFEPWKFVIVQQSALREKLLPVSWGAKKQLPTASHFIVALSRTKEGLTADAPHIRHMMADIQQMSAEAAERKGAVYGNFLANDFDLLKDDRAVFEWGCRQTYIAIGNMMTAAAQIGIDSCPIEGFDKAQVERILREEAVLDGGFGVACMVAFGYRAHDPARPKTRQTLDDIAAWVR